MKFNKQTAIILVLASLLLSTIGAAFYFYNMHQTTLQNNNKKVKVYVAKDAIKKNKEITINDIKEHLITKQELLSIPLTQQEIIGKFAKVDIFRNELFMKEKISDVPIETEEKELLTHKNNSYNIAYKFFRNPNYTLIKGDYIDIVTSYQKTVAELPEYSTQYIGRNIKVLGFSYAGQSVPKGVYPQKIKKVINKKTTEVIEQAKADEIILDIESKPLLALIDDFQKKGNQMWMIKSKSRVDKKTTPTPKKVASTEKTKSVKRSYPYRWYVPKSSITNAKGTIEYANKPGEISQTKQARIVYSYENECAKRDKLLLGIANYVHLRSGTSFQNRILRRVYRNYIITYKEKQGSWYKTCDNKYVHTNEVTEISKEFALEKMEQ